MSGKWIITVIPCFIMLTLSTQLHAQQGNFERTSTAIRLNGTHAISMSPGFKMNSSSSTNTTIGSVDVDANYIGIVQYKYWFENDWSVNASIGVIGAESDVRFANVSSISVIPILFGFSFYPEKFEIGSVGRVYFGLNTGVYMGTASKTYLSSSNMGTGTVNETVFGVEPHFGIDFFILKWVKIGPSFSYHLMGDFEEVIGDRDNYSDPAFFINMGIRF